ncbi:thioredoxin family protein [Planctomyces sp. SH-PL14]|uniref:thioredoxin family protein n=1 Tax=Planctomyces sp. SH-PL14 TaxID=1632864 RepID=UPI00078CAEAE|nr:thioredoxin family protein [Planctomyces sp. SH-PL14]AMV21228.1 Thioredoxin [Planctomyces sp. SH-PL14]
MSEDATTWTRQQVTELKGPAVLEFGTEWCGYCRVLAPTLESLLQQFPDVQHFTVEDGPGQPLGRSFGVKLWPTLVFLKDGQPLSQVARPDRRQALEGLQQISSPAMASNTAE